MPKLTLHGQGPAGTGRGGRGGGGSTVERAFHAMMQNPNYATLSDFKAVWSNSPLAGAVFDRLSPAGQHLHRTAQAPSSRIPWMQSWGRISGAQFRHAAAAASSSSSSERKVERMLDRIERNTGTSARADTRIVRELGTGPTAGRYGQQEAHEFRQHAMAARRIARLREKAAREASGGPGHRYGRFAALGGAGLGGAIGIVSHQSGGGMAGMLAGGAIGGFLGGPAGALLGADVGEVAGKILGATAKAPQTYAAWLNDEGAAQKQIALRRWSARMGRAGGYGRNRIGQALVPGGGRTPGWQSGLGMTPGSAMAVLNGLGITPLTSGMGVRMAQGARIGELMPGMSSLAPGAWQTALASGMSMGLAHRGVRSEVGYAQALSPALRQAQVQGANTVQILKSMDSTLHRLAASGGTINARSVSNLYGRYLRSGLPGGATGQLASHAITSLSGQASTYGQNPVTTLAFNRWLGHHGGSMSALHKGLHAISPGTYSSMMKSASGRQMLHDIVAEQRSGNPVFAGYFLRQALSSHPRALHSILSKGAIAISGVGGQKGPLGRANRTIMGSFAFGGAGSPGAIASELGWNSPGVSPPSTGFAAAAEGALLTSNPGYDPKRVSAYRATLARLGYSHRDIHALMTAGQETGRSPLALAALNHIESGHYSLKMISGPGTSRGPFQMKTAAAHQVAGRGLSYGAIRNTRLGAAIGAARYLNAIKRQHPHATVAEQFGYYENGPNASTYKSRDWQLAGGNLGNLLPERTYQNQARTASAQYAGAENAFSIWSTKVEETTHVMSKLDGGFNDLYSSVTKTSQALDRLPNYFQAGAAHMGRMNRHSQ